jgi:hypothetical protein
MKIWSSCFMEPDIYLSVTESTLLEFPPLRLLFFLCSVHTCVRKTTSSCRATDLMYVMSEHRRWKKKSSLFLEAILSLSAVDKPWIGQWTHLRLFNDATSSSDYNRPIALNETAINECGRNWYRPHLGHYLDICLDGLRKRNALV